MDEYEEVGSSAHLIVTQEEDIMGESTVDIVPEFRRPPYLYPDIASTGGIHVHYPESNHGAPDINPVAPPIIVLDRFSFDYYLHPSLRKKRRRRHKHIFVY